MLGEGCVGTRKRTPPLQAGFLWYPTSLSSPSSDLLLCRQSFCVPHPGHSLHLHVVGGHTLLPTGPYPTSLAGKELKPHCPCLP